MVIINAGSMGVSPMADTISYQAHFHGQDAHAPRLEKMLTLQYISTILELLFNIPRLGRLLSTNAHLP